VLNNEAILRTALRQIHDAGVRFVLVGGLAFIAHGGPLDMVDATVSLVPDPQSGEAFAAFLRTHHARPLGFPPATAFTVQPEHLEPGRLRFLNLQTDLGPIDVLPLPDGVDSFEGLWSRSVEMDLGGFTARVAGLDDLAAMKRAADRPKDRLHLMEIAALIRLRDEAGESKTSEDGR